MVYRSGALLLKSSIYSCNKAIAGNARALKVLKQYSDFAASRVPFGGYSRTVWLDDDEYREYLREQNRNG